MKIRKLHNMPYAQAQIREYRKADGDQKNIDILQSYSTDVLLIDYDAHVVMCGGLYSRTTSKHISSFMREKGMNYYIAKKCYLDNKLYDFVTGEYLGAGA